MTHWTTEMNDRLAALRTEDKSAREIAAIIQFEFGIELTRQQILSQAYKLKLPSHLLAPILKFKPRSRPSSDGWQPKTCQWPDSNCCSPVIPTKSYCPVHYNIAYERKFRE